MTRSSPSVQRHPRHLLLLPSIFIFGLTWILLVKIRLSDTAQEGTSYLMEATVNINNFKAFLTLVAPSQDLARWLTISTPRILSTPTTTS